MCPSRICSVLNWYYLLSSIIILKDLSEEGIFWEAGLFLETPCTEGCNGANNKTLPPGRAVTSYVQNPGVHFSSVRVRVYSWKTLCRGARRALEFARHLAACTLQTLMTPVKKQKPTTHFWSGGAPCVAVQGGGPG